MDQPDQRAEDAVEAKAAATTPQEVASASSVPDVRGADAATAGSDPAEDFRAALHEIESNVEVRRLMLVLANVLVPACAMGIVDCINGSSWPPALAWLPVYVMPVTGALLTAVCALVLVILTRCHFGLVVNGQKMKLVVGGTAPARTTEGLNWFGVTTNFVALVGASAGAGLALALAPLGPVAAAAGAVAPLVLGLVGLRVQHARANALVLELAPSWVAADETLIPRALREEHARKSLDATTADISVIVTMAAALFAGFFNAMTNLGSVSTAVALPVPATVIHSHGVAAMSGWLVVSLLLSARMVVRLRLALAEHSARLAELREEDDDPWTFRVTERTFALYLLVQALVLCSAVIFSWSLVGPLVAAVAAGVLGVVLLAVYPLMLAAHRRRRAAART